MQRFTKSSISWPLPPCWLEVFGFVKNLSESKRRQNGSRERSAGKGAQTLAPPRHCGTPERTTCATAWPVASGGVLGCEFQFEEDVEDVLDGLAVRLDIGVGDTDRCALVDELVAHVVVVASLGQ